MRIVLLHNPSAGQEDHCAEELTQRLEDAGHSVRCLEVKKDFIEKIFDEPADLAVAAGGDGTVRRAALALEGRDLPFSILALGTANHLARTLRLNRPVEEIIPQLAAFPPRSLDLGAVEGAGGSGRFIEGFGGGLFPHYLAALDSASRDSWLKEMKENHGLGRDWRLLPEILKDYPAQPFELRVDERDCSREYLMVEVLNIQSVGPFPGLAPDANPGDGWMDLILVGEKHRAALVEYFAELRDSGEARFPVPAMRCRRVQLQWAGQALHLDDALWPKEPTGVSRSGAIDLSLRPGSLMFCGPPPI